MRTSGRGRGMGPFGAAVLSLCVLLGSWSVAAAHHRGDAGPASGLSIPSLTHGQMSVLAPYRAAILALADAEPQPDAVLRRLRNFAALERSFCFWGVMPGSVNDEASPFNECAHAEHAALRALLLHMGSRPDAGPAALRLQADVAREMAVRGESLTLCRFSDEPFNTAALIGPDWAALPDHGPTLLTLLASIAFASAGALAAWAGLRREAAPAQGPR